MANPASAASGRQTVLVVDDDTIVGNLCTAMLTQDGFDALYAGGSSEALKLCKEHKGRIDLLITDLVMPPPMFQLASSSNEFPHVHGHELALRAIQLREGLRVLVMSGNPDQELAGYGVTPGNFPFVQKPFGVEELLTAVHDVLQAPPPFPADLAPKPSDRDVSWFD